MTRIELNQPKSKDASAANAFLSGNLSQVDVSKIERELSSLWDSVSQGENEGPVIKACALNIVLLTEEGDQTKFDQLLSEITFRHPCRAILAVVASARGASAIEAWVSARCHFLPGRTDKQMCCEQITVKFSGEEFKSEILASVITPLVIPDLPSWLFLGTSQHGLDLAPFLTYLDHVLIDSRMCGLDRALLMRELDASLSLSQDVVVVDLAWLTITPWRTAIALAFDEEDVAISAGCLSTISNVKVTYRGSLSQALLLASWLAARLARKFKSADGSCLRFDGEHGDLLIELCQDDSVCVSDGLANVAIDFHPVGCCNTTETLSISYQSGALKVVCGDKSEFVQLPYSKARLDCGSQSIPELVDQALELTKKDSIYEESAKLARLLLCERSFNSP